MDLEALYSFRINYIHAEFVHPEPELAPLAAIQAKLVEAGALADARRFQRAISSYQAVKPMILRHLTAKKAGQPIRAIGTVQTGPITDYRLELELFEPLLSASTEWLNVLPVEQPKPSVRSRVEPNSEAMAAVTVNYNPGLFSDALVSQTVIEASADLRVAAQLTSSGNTSAAKFFADRAQSLVDRSTTMDQSTLELMANATLVSDVEARSSIMFGQVGLQDNLNLAEAAATVAARAVHVVDHGSLQLPPEVTDSGRSLVTMIGGEAHTFRWEAGSSPPQDQIKQSVYEARREFTELAHLLQQPATAAEAALNLPHTYYYVIPLGLAECHRGLGDYAAAERNYLKAAAYQYLNQKIEAPFLWLRLAETYVAWADSLYLMDETKAARELYERVAGVDGSPPSGSLYSDTLRAGAEAGRKVLENLDPLVSGVLDVDAISVNPDIAAVVLEAHSQLVKLDAGLDYWGHFAATVPIWTFEYLQGAAINFAHLAIAAERDFIQFQDRSDQGVLTQEHLRQGVTLARAEKNAVKRQTAVAEAESEACEWAVTASLARADNAWAAHDDYADHAPGIIIRQALAAQMGAGEDGDPAKLNAYADAMVASVSQRSSSSFLGNSGWQTRTEGHVSYSRSWGGPWRLAGSAATMSAAAGLIASRLSAENERRSLERQAQEMELAAGQAQIQLKVARARVKAAEAAEAVAEARVKGARRSLAAFDGQYFTPEVWGRMGDAMRALSGRYLHMAIRTARLMQRAYNFETDQDLDLIKMDYGAGQVKGLLGADLLMADIQSFTFDLITNTRGKSQPVRQTISLAERCAHAFENQLRQTGTMDFQTRLEDFDEAYPGTYGGRIEKVEVAIDGVIPPIGVTGALTNEGISFFRTLRPDAEGNTVRPRVQSRETLVLSDYNMQSDVLVNPEDPRLGRIFQGAGLASAWRLELPPEINDLDLQAVTDVRLTFHYKARYDPDLRTRMLDELAEGPGANERQLGLPLRWLYPEAFFHFYETGVLELTIEPEAFPGNQLDPIVTDTSMVVVTSPASRADGVVLAVSAPGRDTVSIRTVSGGMAAGRDLAGATGGPATGEWRVEVRPSDNPSWVEDGRLVVEAIQNLALVIDYSFTRRP